MRVVHLISGLSVGGAENMLCKLLQARTIADAHVISLTTDGLVGERIRALGVGTTVLGLRRGLPGPGALARLVSVVRQLRPDVLQTWMYHSDLLGGLAARALGGIRVAWGIRTSTLDPQRTKRTTRWTRRACALLSRRLPDVIVSCSQVAADLHVGLGYARERMRVIPNGFDLEQFRPDPTARLEVRRELGIPQDAAVVGMAARFDPQKDHAMFLRAAALVAKRRGNVVFVLCGDGTSPANPSLSPLIGGGGLEADVRMLGRRDDMPRLVASWDVAALSSSYGEGFPNSIGEAMSCAVPCVATDIGDTRHLVRETGIVVPPRDAEAFGAALIELLDLPPSDRLRMGQAARERMRTEFSIERIAACFEALYHDLAGAPREGTS